MFHHSRVWGAARQHEGGGQPPQTGAWRHGAAGMWTILVAVDHTGSYKLKIKCCTLDVPIRAEAHVSTGSIVGAHIS